MLSGDRWVMEGVRKKFGYFLIGLRLGFLLVMARTARKFVNNKFS